MKPYFIFYGVLTLAAAAVGCGVEADETAASSAALSSPVVATAGRAGAPSDPVTACRSNEDCSPTEVCEGSAEPNGGRCRTATCEIAGHVYRVGESFLDPRSCNTCQCGREGIICTLMYCPVCTVDGYRFPAGTSFVGADLCNSCFCSETGVVGCTRMACRCVAGQPHNRRYLIRFPYEGATDEAELAARCPSGTRLFVDRTGIGCEQNECCQETYNCMPPRDCSIPKDRCPFSLLAL